MLEKDSLSLLADALNKLEEGFKALPSFVVDTDLEKMAGILEEVAERMKENYPYFHPYYAGQMLKPPHPIARLSYMLAMWINPNNHALDGGIASSKMEKEVVKDLASMFGWETHLGHLTGGGTMANMEALWVAGQIHPGKSIVASELSHYTHQRISEVLQLPFQVVPCNKQGTMDLKELQNVLESHEVGTVVATLGSTGIGKVDPLGGILELQKKYGFRIHLDAAYGGYFVLAQETSDQVGVMYEKIDRADSIVIDPHKHGLQPYGCGCILFKDPSVGKYYQHDSPYTYYSSEEMHLGEISLECSRAGASAVGLWATHQYMPPVKGGDFAKDLDKCIQAAKELYIYMDAHPLFLPLYQPELDIIVWGLRADTLSQITQKSQSFFDLAARRGLHLALFNYPARLLPSTWDAIEHDTPHVTCLRSVLMKPAHLDWIKEIWRKMEEIVEVIY